MGRCIKHGVDNIDVWYDCEECLNENVAWCEQNKLSNSYEWVELNIGNWDFSCCRQKNYRRRIKQNNKRL